MCGVCRCVYGCRGLELMLVTLGLISGCEGMHVACH